jgi:hypothetical protein
MRLRSSMCPCVCMHRGVISLAALTLFSLPAFGTVTISSPTNGSTSISAVSISASADDTGSFHYEVWDNGYKLGNVFTSTVTGVYVLPNGSHTLTVNVVNSSGTVLDKGNVTFTVKETCTTSTSVQCDMDQQGINNTQNLNDPPGTDEWTANPDGSGIQGDCGTCVEPTSTDIQAVSESAPIPDQNNTTLNGKSLELSLTHPSGDWSNTLFSADSPNNAPTSPVDTHWTLDEYAMLPTIAANQAFEVDAQYVIDDVWTKFYTECAFNQAGKNPDGSAGTGYWEVFDTSSPTPGWIILNGEAQGDQTPPSVPCTYSMFEQPWTGSSNPSFNGWHHIVWNFLRNSDGTITFVSVAVDGNTSTINYDPPSNPGGSGSNNGAFSALVQLDGINTPGYTNVTAYINELNITHTP